MSVKVFRAKGRDRRYRVEFRGARSWALDNSYHTYVVARFQVALWNSLDIDARIIDTREGEIDL